MKKFRIGGVEVVRRVPRSRDSFFGRDLSTGRELVLKRFSLEDDEERKRFRQLCEMLSRKSNLFANCQFISKGDLGYAIREYVPGISLDQISKSTLRPNDIVDFGVQISQHLAAVHGSGIAHGNIKPSNLVLTHDHKIKVIDFAVTGEGHDARSDLRSVGTVLSNMIDKRRSTPPELKAILDNLLQPYSELRMQSAEELQDALKRVGATLEQQQHRESTASAGKPTKAPQKTEVPRLQRFVNTWLQTEGAEQLRKGEWYAFNMNIGTLRQGEAASAVPFSEPDWGDKKSLQLVVTFFSRDFEIKRHSLDLDLPRVGDAPVVSTKVKPLRAGACEIEVVISLAKELEVLQIVRAEVEVEEAAASIVSKTA
jgi:tRNA A-37 threonylcarbamoyl transferase component Bud32